MNRKIDVTKRFIVIFCTLNFFVTSILFLWLFFTSKSIDSASFFILGSSVYILGLRHALDADHITAIDNAIRKLLQEGKPATLCGFFFALGHSSVVFLLCLALLAAQRTAFHAFSDLQIIGSEISSVISSVFLFIIAFINFLIFLETLRAYKQAKSGKTHSFNNKTGFASRLFKRLFNIVHAQHHMYLIGFLFGLSFETATQTALFAISVAETGVNSDLALISLLVYPLLFAAGMTLVDTINGFFMCVTYQWSFSNYLKKVRYNLMMLTLTIFMAWLVVSLKLLSFLQNTLDLHGSIWDTVEIVTSNFWEIIGVFIVLSFAILWLFSLFSVSKKNLVWVCLRNVKR
jgi:high-affinity nickel-transport protein